MNERKALLWMLAPAAGIIGVLFAGGLWFAFAESISGGDGVTLRAYQVLLSDTEFLAALRLTLLVALGATAISAAVGLGLAIVLLPVVRRWSGVVTLLQVPVAVPHLAIAMVLINALSPSGLLARLGYAAGLIGGHGDFPQLLQDSHGVGILITYVLKESPFVALMVLAVLLRVDREYQDVARTLGASSWQRLRWVTLPLVAPALLSSSLIVLAFVFSAFEVPFLMGRPYPAMLSVVAQKRFLDPDLAQRPAAMAIAFVMMGIVTLLALLYSRVHRAGLERPAL